MFWPRGHGMAAGPFVVIALLAILYAPIGSALPTGDTFTRQDNFLRTAPLVVPALTIYGVSVLEGDAGTSDAVFLVSLSLPAALDVTVDYATAEGTALADSDYIPVVGSLTIPAGQLYGTIAVAVIGDLVEEPDEEFTVELSNSANATISEPTAPGTILDNDRGLTIDDVSVVEGNGGSRDALFTVTLSLPKSMDVTVGYHTVNGTALAGEDYTQKSGSLTIKKGLLRGTIAISVKGDTVDEPDETFTVELFNAVGATIYDPSGLGTIIDDDLVEMTINDRSVVEGDLGTSGVAFTVSLTQAIGLDVTVDYATQDGSAVAGIDYVQANGTLTIPAGQTSRTITVQVIGDTLDEPNETFTVELSNAVNTTIVDGSGLCTILDDDALPELSIYPASIVEGDIGTSDVLFLVALSQLSTVDVTVDYATVDGTAIAGVDYEASAGTLTIPAGQQSRTIAVAVIGDTEMEPDETFTVELSNAVNATILDASGVGTIEDDDSPSLTIDDVSVVEGDTGASDALGRAATQPGASFVPPAPTIDLLGLSSDILTGQVPLVVPELSVLDASVVEGDTGATSVVFTVLLSAIVSLDVTVEYTTLDGTAVAGDDYESVTGTLTIPAGQWIGTIAVPVIGDTLAEPDETFTVELSNAVNATIAEASGLGTIFDDDGGTATGKAVFTVTLNKPGFFDVAVEYATFDGTAVAGIDYQPTSGTLTIPAGQSSGTIVVLVIGDTQDEPDETFTVELSNAVNATIEDASGMGTILDDDLPIPTLTIDDVSVVEGDLGTTDAVFTVSLSQSVPFDVSVDYATQDGTAVEGSDYQRASGTLTIPVGQVSGSITVPVIGETLVESDETFTVVLSNPVNAVITDASGLGTILNDDPLSLTIEDISLLEGDSGTTDAVFAVMLNKTGGISVSVNYSTLDGTAVGGVDYQSAAGTLTIPAGQLGGIIAVPVIGDTEVEPDETFTVELSNPVNATILDASGVGTILDDDLFIPSLTIGDVSVVEGDSGTSNAVFTVSLSQAGSLDVTVDYATQDGTAIAGLDYQGTAGTLTIPAGLSSGDIIVPVIGDTTSEPDETFTVELSNAVNATITDSSGLGIILDDDVCVFERDSGTTDVVVIVRLSQPNPLDVTIDYTTMDRTALAGVDYLATAGSLTIPKGDLTGTIAIPVIGDTLPEPDRIFSVELSNAASAPMADSSIIVNIHDDDGVLLSDDFEDGILDWTVDQGVWDEVGGVLTARGDPVGIVIAPVPWIPSGGDTCKICTVETTMRVSGEAEDRAYLLGWFKDSANFVELTMNPLTDTWTISQWIGGAVTAASSASAPIDPDVDYEVSVSYKGPNFFVLIDGTRVITMRATLPPGGNFGFKVFSTTGTFGSILVY